MLNGLLWSLALFAFPRQDAAVVLHYNIDVGIDFIGEGKQIVLLPLVGLLIIIGNGLIAWSIRRIHPVAFWVLWGG